MPKSCCSTITTTRQEQDGSIALLVGSRDEFVAFMTKQVGDAALAEDIVQSSLLKASERIEQLASAESARAWFYRLLRNAAADARRRRSVEQRAVDAFELEQPGSVEAVERERTVCRCVSRALSSLKPDYQSALRSVEIDGAAVKDFAAQEEIQPGNAAVRVFRAREALKRKVESACGDCAADGGCYDCTCV